MVVEHSNLPATAQPLDGTDRLAIGQNVVGTFRTRRTTLTAIKAFAFAVAGTAPAPGIPVASATAGLFSGGSGATEFLGAAANGTEFFRSTSAQATFAVPVLFPAGTASLPSVAVGELDTGLYLAAAGSLGIAADGAVMARFSSTGTSFGAGAATPAHEVEGRRTSNLSVATVAASQGSAANTLTAIGGKGTRFLGKNASTTVGSGCDFTYGTADVTKNLAAAFGMAMVTTSASGTIARAYIATKTAEADTVLLERLSVTPGGFTMVALNASAGASDLFHVYSTTLTADIFRCSDSLGTIGIGMAPVSGVKLSITQPSGTQFRLLYDGSNLLSASVGSTGLTTWSGSGSSSAVRFQLVGQSNSGIVSQLQVLATTALAAGVGGIMSLHGVNTGGGTTTAFAAVGAYKQNATDSETGAHLDFYSRTNGSNLARNMRIGASSRVLVRAGITTDVCDASAQFQIDSTTAGFLPPRMTTTQRDAVSSPAAGLVIYNTSTNKLNVYTTAWEAVTSA